jgi:hypothetical protein
MPGRDGFWSNNLRCRGPRFPAKTAANLGQAEALSVQKAQPIFKLIP